MRRFHVLLALAVGLAGPVVIPADGPDKSPRTLSPETITAWKKAAATVVYWAGPDPFGSVEYRDPAEARPGDVPMFEFAGWKAGVLGRLPQPERGFGLDLRDIQLTDAYLKDLGRLRRLQVLTLSPQFGKHEMSVTDAGLKALAGLHELRLLDLEGTRVTDAGLKELAQLKSLRGLDLANTAVTDAGLRDLAALKELQALNLGETKVTDAGLKNLAGLPGLKGLGLWGTRVTDGGLKELKALPGIEALQLTDTRVTGAGLKELGGLRQLEVLELGLISVTRGELKELAGLKNFRTLGLQNTHVTGERVKELVGAAPLRITAADCEQLVAELVNPGRPPFKRSYVFDEDLKNQDEIRARQKKVEAAYARLSDGIEVSLPVLMKHIGDEPFSHVADNPFSGSIIKVSVGGACADIVREHVEVYHGHTEGLEAGDRPTSLWFISDCGGMEKWWQSRKGKPLAELQLEAIEWVLRHERPKYKSEKEWAESRRALEDIARAIRTSRTPIVVLGRVHLFENR